MSDCVCSDHCRGEYAGPGCTSEPAPHPAQRAPGYRPPYLAARAPLPVMEPDTDVVLSDDEVLAVLRFFTRPVDSSDEQDICGDAVPAKAIEGQRVYRPLHTSELTEEEMVALGAALYRPTIRYHRGRGESLTNRDPGDEDNGRGGA